MARNNRNFAYQTYVDDDGDSWNIRGETGGAFAAVDGHAAFNGANPVFGAVSRMRHPRYVVAQDPTTFRTVKGIIYTAAAYAALARGATIAVGVPGLVGTVDYTVSDKIPERLPTAKAARQLADF